MIKKFFLFFLILISTNTFADRPLGVAADSAHASAVTAMATLGKTITATLKRSIPAWVEFCNAMLLAGGAGAVAQQACLARVNTVKVELGMALTDLGLATGELETAYLGSFVPTVTEANALQVCAIQAKANVLFGIKTFEAFGLHSVNMKQVMYFMDSTVSQIGLASKAALADTSPIRLLAEEIMLKLGQQAGQAEYFVGMYNSTARNTFKEIITCSGVQNAVNINLKNAPIGGGGKGFAGGGGGNGLNGGGSSSTSTGGNYDISYVTAYGPSQLMSLPPEVPLDFINEYSDPEFHFVKSDGGYWSDEYRFNHVYQVPEDFVTKREVVFIDDSNQEVTVPGGTKFCFGTYVGGQPGISYQDNCVWVLSLNLSIKYQIDGEENTVVANCREEGTNVLRETLRAGQSTSCPFSIKIDRQFAGQSINGGVTIWQMNIPGGGGDVTTQHINWKALSVVPPGTCYSFENGAWKWNNSCPPI